MSKRLPSLGAVAVCGLALSVLTALPARAAVIAKAQAGANPFVRVWVDTGNGIQRDAQAETAFHDLFARTDWTVTDDRQLTVSKNGNKLLTAVYESFDQNTLLLFHGRGNLMTLDGLISRDPQDPSKGVEELFITQFTLDGKSRSIFIFAGLTFASDSGGGNGGGGGGGG